MVLAQRTRLASSIGLVAALSVGAASAPREALAEKFKLVVVAADSSARQMPRTVWLGVQNRTQTPRLICVLSRAAWPKTVEEGSNPVAAEGFSPHGCQTDESYTIVLPNETAFVAWRLPPSLEVRPDRVLVVKVDVTSRAFVAGAQTTMTLEWTGTGAEMISAKRAMERK